MLPSHCWLVGHSKTSPVFYLQSLFIYKTNIKRCINTDRSFNFKRFTLISWFDLHSIYYFHSGWSFARALPADPGAHTGLQPTVLGVIMVMETRHTRKTLLALAALHLEGLVQVQDCVRRVDVRLHLRVRRHGHAAGGAHVPTSPLRRQVPHAASVRRFHFVFAPLRTHARAGGRLGRFFHSGGLNDLSVVHAAVVLAVKAPVVLQELAFGFEPHAVAEATEMGTLHFSAVLVRAVPPDGGLFEERLRTVSADEPLEVVAARVAAVLADLRLGVEDVLAHPAHPRTARGLRRVLSGFGHRDQSDVTAGGRLRVQSCAEIFFLSEVSVTAMDFGHVQQDVFVTGHFHAALAAEEQEVGEVRSPVVAAHVQAGDRGLPHVFAADAALMENLVRSQKMLSGRSLFWKLEAALTTPNERQVPAAADLHTGTQLLSFRWRSIDTASLVSFLKRRLKAKRQSFLLLLYCTLLNFIKPTVLKQCLSYCSSELDLVLRRLFVALDLGVAEEHFRAESAPASHLKPFHKLHYCMVSLGHGAAVSALHAKNTKKRKC